MSTAMNPNEALPCEDIVSWIEEFSYIYSSGLFGSDDVLISGDNECPSLQEQSKVDVLDAALQYPEGPSDTTSGDAEPFTQWLACSRAHTSDTYLSETSAWGTECVEGDEDVDRLKSNSSYHGGRLQDGREVTVHRKRGRRRRKLFGGHREKSLDASHTVRDRLQSLYAKHGRDFRKAFRLLDPGSYMSSQHYGQPNEHPRQLYSQPKHNSGTLDSLPRHTYSKPRMTRKPGRCPLRDPPEPNENRTGSTATSTSSSHSWLSDVKCRLKSLSPRSLKRKASTLWLRDIACLSPDDFQDTNSTIHTLPMTEGFTSTQTLPLPLDVSKGTSTGSKTLVVDSTVSPCHTGAQKHDMELTIEASLGTYQCTFCLAQCTSKHDWMQHERTYHLQSQQRWANAPERFSESQDSRIFTPNSQHSSHTCVTRSSESHGSTARSELDEPMDDLFWNCGFCNFVLRSWDERQEHIAHEHFEQGTTMALWDPLKAPYPWKRRIGAPIPGFSSRELEELLANQSPELADSMERNYEPMIRNVSACRLCHLPSKDREAAAKHKEMWHKPRSVWSCPAALSPDDTFFDTSKRSDGSIRDICLCCGKSFKYTQRDPEILMRHLRNSHGFDEYPCLQMCFDKGQFYLHLANSHDFYLEFIQDFMVSCELKGGAPAMMES